MITLDANAAGNSWYLDTSPLDDSEFGAGKSPQGIDLLSAISHEIGHILGFEHDASGLMERSLGQGERRLVTDIEHDHAQADDYLAMDAELGELVGKDFASSAGQVTREILAGRMVDWSL